MRVLITGTSGMIGSSLSERLLEQGHDVIPVDRLPNRWSPVIDAMTRRVDLLDECAVETLPTDVDWVIHLAANARVHDLVVDPRGARENMITAFNAIELARRAGAFCVFASSREVYGNQGFDTYTEDLVDPEQLESPYAASKLAGEVMLRSYGRAYGLSHCVVRFSNVYGRNDTSDRFVPIVFKRLLDERGPQPITIYGKDKSLDFTYLDDTLDGIELILNQPERANTRTFNLSRGQRATLIEAAEMIAERVGRPLELIIADSRPGEVTHYQGDIEAARTHLGYAPSRDLWEGLHTAAAWYADRYRHAEADRLLPAVD